MNEQELNNLLKEYNISISLDKKKEKTDTSIFEIFASTFLFLILAIVCFA